jgi:hypothetical protein
MPRVTLRADESVDGKEDTVSEYICDWPDCPNVAVHVVGVVRELRAFVAMCSDHARMAAERSKR